MKTVENERPEQGGDAQQIHAANLDVVHEDTASAEVKQLYEQFREDLGVRRCRGFSSALRRSLRCCATCWFATFNRVVNAFGLPSQELLKLFEMSQKRIAGGAGNG